MIAAQAQIPTHTPARYIAQLCKHADSMRQKNPHLRSIDGGEHPRVERVEQTDSDATLTLSIGRCILHADTEQLTVRAEAADEQHLRQIQHLITRDLQRFGHREQLAISWRQPAGSQDVPPPNRTGHAC